MAKMLSTNDITLEELESIRDSAQQLINSLNDYKGNGYTALGDRLTAIDNSIENFETTVNNAVSDVNTAVGTVNTMSSTVTTNSNQIGNQSDSLLKMGYDITWNALLALNGDWTTAFNTALTNNKRVYIPRGTFKVNGTIVVGGSNKLLGAGRGLSIIECQLPDIPIISVSGKFVEISDLTIKRSNWTPSTNSNAIGIKLGASSFVSHSKFTQLEISSCYNAIRADNTSNVYSCTFDGIWAYAFSDWAIRLEPYGSTGCIFDNIYINNWNDYSNKTKFTALGGMIVKVYSELDIRQINIEHGIYGYGVYVGDCDTANIRTIHVEGYEQTGDYRGILMCDASWVSVDTMSVVYSAPNFDRTTFNPVGVTMWNLIGINRGGRVHVETLFNRNNYSVEKVGGGVTTVNTTGMTNNCAYNADGSQVYKDSTALTVRRHKNKDNKFTSFSSFVEQGGGRTHQIREYDNNVYYQKLSDNTVINYFKKATPTDGYWKSGDRLMNTSNTAGMYSDLKCTDGGYLNPPASGVTTTVGTAFVSDIVVSSQGSFVTGDRITIVGSSRTFKITNIYTSSGTVHFVLDQNIEVTVTSAAVQYATPVFKGMNMIAT